MNDARSTAGPTLHVAGAAALSPTPTSKTTMPKKLPDSPTPTEGTVETPMGSIHTKDKMFLRVDAGKASASDGKKYEFSILVSGEMVVQSTASGRWFIADWEKVLHHAVEQGIDNP